MTIWVIIYSHRHGVDAWPISQETRPDEADIIAGLEDWEGEGRTDGEEPREDESLEIRGPFFFED